MKRIFFLFHYIPTLDVRSGIIKEHFDSTRPKFQLEKKSDIAEYFSTARCSPTDGFLLLEAGFCWSPSGSLTRTSRRYCWITTVDHQDGKSRSPQNAVSGIQSSLLEALVLPTLGHESLQNRKKGKRGLVNGHRGRKGGWSETRADASVRRARGLHTKALGIDCNTTNIWSTSILLDQDDATPRFVQHGVPLLHFPNPSRKSKKKYQKNPPP